ncbi:hypothetical protein [Diatraea saccharalis granulovirus]|uniref:Uncharacterized protein n=1 Tax=Diatraea saccharalis granulovirus TaxID=1675862 RepID=A0A0R7EYW2_9BBAC|nr:hypothetical protein [Diatraea saccharalis granulovirus]AKN80777.1 hypothetical protein [Diatraea saccharalis granulovirus]
MSSPNFFLIEKNTRPLPACSRGRLIIHASACLSSVNTRTCVRLLIKCEHEVSTIKCTRGRSRPLNTKLVTRTRG